MTPEPLIPFCKINEAWFDPPKHGAKEVLEGSTRFCTLFRPTLTDTGICSTMNLFRRVNQLFSTILDLVMGHKASLERLTSRETALPNAS